MHMPVLALRLVQNGRRESDQVVRKLQIMDNLERLTVDFPFKALELDPP